MRLEDVDLHAGRECPQERSLGEVLGLPVREEVGENRVIGQRGGGQSQKRDFARRHVPRVDGGAGAVAHDGDVRAVEAQQNVRVRGLSIDRRPESHGHAGPEASAAFAHADAWGKSNVV
jgi:hypothetical protein